MHKITKCTSIKCGFLTTNGALEQFVLKRFDAAPFCCVINKCQTRTTDKLEKCVHSVVLLCSICRNLYRTKSIREQHSFLGVIWRKLLIIHTDYFEKLMVNMLHRKICVNNGLGVSKVLTLKFQTRNTENYKNIRWCRIANIVERRWFANTKTTRRAIGR